jgi:hypothetical protein
VLCHWHSLLPFLRDMGIFGRHSKWCSAVQRLSSSEAAVAATSSMC